MAAKGMSEADARELIDRAVKSFGGKEAVEGSKAVIDAMFELAREGSKMAGEKKVSIKVRTLGENEDDGSDGSTITIANQSGPPVNAGPGRRIPIRYGGTGYTCILVWRHPVIYVCVAS
jgi:hypothetical protein